MSRTRAIRTAVTLVATAAVLAPVGVAFSDASGPTNSIPGHCRRWVEHDNDPQEHAGLEFLRRCNVTRTIHVTRTRTKTVHPVTRAPVTSTATSTSNSTFSFTTPVATTTTTVTDPNLTTTTESTITVTTTSTSYTSTVTATSTVGICVADAPDC